MAALHWCVGWEWACCCELILLDISRAIFKPNSAIREKTTPSHLSLPVFPPWDGTNITYGRHHAVTELLSSPSTNNSVAMDLIKRNGTNYGPFPARDIMYCNVLAWPQQPVQTSRDWAGWQRERERERGRMWLGRAKRPRNNQSGYYGSMLWWRGGTHREMYRESKPVGSAETGAARGNGTSTAFWPGMLSWVVIWMKVRACQDQLNKCIKWECRKSLWI